ncbi:hypothetical protein M3J09_006285 [Ascochyta lentis]
MDRVESSSLRLSLPNAKHSVTYSQQLTSTLTLLYSHQRYLNNPAWTASRVHLRVLTGETRRLSPRGSLDRMIAHLDLGAEGAAEETPDISAKSIGIPKRRGTTPTFNNDLRDFCTASSKLSRSPTGAKSSFRSTTALCTVCLST